MIKILMIYIPFIYLQKIAFVLFKNVTALQRRGFCCYQKQEKKMDDEIKNSRITFFSYIIIK